MSSSQDQKVSPVGGRLPPLSREMKHDNSFHRNTDASQHKAASRNTFGQGKTTDGPSYSESWSNQYNYMDMALIPKPDMPLADARVKPKFLYDLENFLLRELDALGVAVVKPNETRLQAHREVFEYLIEDFKSYKPILASIKNEYEMMLEYQTECMKQLEPLEQMLSTVNEQCDKQIMKIRDDEKSEIINVRRENEQLQTVIDSFKNEQFALQTQVEKLKLKHKEQHAHFRSEADKRKVLVSDINDLRTQQEDLLYQQQQANNKDKSEDPAVIRQLLKESRENERQATDRINNIVANYGDVIPKKDYLELQDQFMRLEGEHKEKEEEFHSLKQQHESLLETQRQVIRLRDEFYQESERLRQTATPRPDWNRCANIIAGGAQRWQEISEGKSSDELVGLLLNELAGTGPDAQQTDYFTGQGLSEEVPYHLRYEGSVKNRNLGKRDTSLLIRDVWRQKDNSEPQAAENYRQMPMSEYLIQYLKSKFPNEKMVYEWSYNIHNACQRYPHDDKIKLFYGVLTNDLEEELYFSQIHYIVSLLKHLTKANEGHEPEGIFTQQEFRQALTDYFTTSKTEEDIEQLMRAANSELDEPENTDMDYTRLFFEDDEGKFGPFVDQLKKQLDTMRLTYIQNIIEALQQAGSEQVTPTDLEANIYKNDPSLDSVKIESLVLSTFNVKTRAELESAAPVTHDRILTHLYTRHIKRFDQSV